MSRKNFGPLSIGLAAGILYALIDLIYQSTDMMLFWAVAQSLVMPLYPLNGLLRGMLDVDLRHGGIEFPIRAISFSAVVLGNVMPFQKFQSSGQRRYHVISVLIWLWSSLSIIGGFALMVIHNLEL